VLRTENSGEFREKEFDQFCKQCATYYQTTTPYTPQKNGFSKRMNRTLMDKVRSMLSGDGLAQEFWVEAVVNEKYLLNMSPLLVLFDIMGGKSSFGFTSKSIWF
jgi:hypothetical protein